MGDLLKRQSRKITITLFIAQCLNSAAFIMLGTVGTIAGAVLSKNTSLAGAPPATLNFGAALASLGVGFAMDRFGRRSALAYGSLVGALGGLVSFFAFLGGSFPGFLSGLLVLGLARAAGQLSRFTAAEVTPPSGRGKAISLIVLAGTVGSVAGPLLLGPAEAWSIQAGLPNIAGSFVLLAVILSISTVVMLAGLRPDPKEISRQVSELYPEAGQAGQASRSLWELVKIPAVIVALVGMVTGQVVMIMLMGITSLHMSDHQHSLANISVVFSAHTFGMFAFSVFSGYLTDRWGRVPVILTGAVVILVSCLLAPLSPHLLPLSAALFLLGFGWNFTYVGGSALLADQLTLSERARTSGATDLLIGLVTTAGSLASGFIFAASGYGTLGWVGAGLTLIPLILTAWWALKNRRARFMPV